MSPSETPTRGEVVIYRAPDGGVELDVRLEQETIWLNLNQLAALFERNKSVISRHLRNVFKEGELDREAVVAKNATTAADGKTYQVEYFNLDAIISVGYRVNSRRGTQFRIWATRILRTHLLQGYTVNERRLRDLNQAVKLIADTAQRRDLSGDEARALLAVVGDYRRALGLLDDYDHQRVSKARGIGHGGPSPGVRGGPSDRGAPAQPVCRVGDLRHREGQGSGLGPGGRHADRRRSRGLSLASRRRLRTSSISWSRTTPSWMGTNASQPRCSCGSSSETAVLTRHGSRRAHSWP